LPKRLPLLYARLTAWAIGNSLRAGAIPPRAWPAVIPLLWWSILSRQPADLPLVPAWHGWAGCPI